MLSSVQKVQEWFSPFLLLEEKIANLSSIARDDDSSNKLGT